MTIPCWSHCISSESRNAFFYHCGRDHRHYHCAIVASKIVRTKDGILSKPHHSYMRSTCSFAVVSSSRRCLVLGFRPPAQPFAWQIRKEIRSHPRPGMDARPSHCSDRSRCGVRGTHLWGTTRYAEQESMEPKRPNGLLESFAERLFVDRDAPNDAAALAQSL